MLWSSEYDWLFSVLGRPFNLVFATYLLDELQMEKTAKVPVYADSDHN
jgi:hypothetical protein